MAENKERKTIEYRVLKIQSLKFSFEDLELKEIENIFKTRENLNLSFKTKADFNIEKSHIAIDIQSELSVVNDTTTLLVEHLGRTVYEVKGLKDFYIKEEKEFNLPDDFMVQLFAIAFSHTRALLSMEINATSYKEHYMLPVIDPAVFLKPKT